MSETKGELLAANEILIQRDNLQRQCDKLLEASKELLQEVEEYTFEQWGINPGEEDETNGAKLGRAAIAAAEKVE